MSQSDDVLENLQPRLSASFAEIFDENPKLRRKLAEYHPVKAANTVAALLTYPSFHQIVLRLEYLVHLFLLFGRGQRIPNENDINHLLFDCLGKSFVKRLEDPVEDVFVTNVVTANGNVRIFTGLWDNSGFYLQRILNIVKTLPDKSPFPPLKKEVHALARLSEEIVRRANIRENTEPNIEGGNPKVPPPSVLKKLVRGLSFTENELEKIGVTASLLAPFIYSIDDRAGIELKEIGESQLEFCPIVRDGTRLVVLLPTAISVAIRNHVIVWMTRNPFLESFNAHIAREYIEFLNDIPFFGRPIPKNVLNAGTQQVGQNLLVEIGLEIDRGYFVQLIAIVDRINLPYRPSFVETKDAETAVIEYVDKLIQRNRSQPSSLPGFRQGLTIIVGCGLGHATMFEMPRESGSWAIEFISAPDLEILSWKSMGSKYLIWQLAEFRRFLQGQDLLVTRIHGLLSIAGWLEGSDYLLNSGIPFHQSPIQLHLGFDFIIDVKKKIRHEWDLQALPHPDGKFHVVRRSSAQSYFSSEPSPRYVCLESLKTGILSNAWKGKKGVWWVEILKDNKDLSRDSVYRIWDAVVNWMERITAFLEPRIEAHPPILIALDLENLKNDQVAPTPAEQLDSLIEIETDLHRRTIRVSIKDPFWGGFRHPKNYAERSLVTALIKGILNFIGKAESQDTIEEVVNGVIGNQDARHIHLFQAVSFRENIPGFDDVSALLVDDMTSARSKLNLGWQVQQRPYVDCFPTEAESNPFLHKVVDFVWSRIKTKLEIFNKQQFVEKAFRHIEGVDLEKTQWERAMKAMLALNPDRGVIQDTARKQIGKFHSSKIALRLLIEMAVCQCPIDSGSQPGDLDFANLMVDVLILFHVGGWSDAITKKVMEPEIKIAPSGEIRAHVGFRDEIADPYGEHSATLLLNQAADSYESSYKPFQPVERVDGIFPAHFLSAFEKEFELSVDQFRAVKTLLEDIALARSTCVYTATRNELIASCSENQFVSEVQLNSTLKHFSLWPRKAFDKSPKGFENRDWYPWRFGRKLSVMARPIIRLEENENPRFVISPGQMSESLAYILHRYLHAEVEPSDCNSQEMKDWINEEVQRRGHAFAKTVSELLKGLGYEIRLELPITELIQEGTEINYGDIDVFAWKATTPKVFCIECKNLRTAKTANEVAEQLNRFSGLQSSNGGRDDLLKHLDRCEFLQNKKSSIARFIGMTSQEIGVQGVVCFSKPVPMLFMSKQFPNIIFKTIDDLKAEF